MALSENIKHDLLLIIATALFIGFSLGLGAKRQVPQAIVIPPV